MVVLIVALLSIVCPVAFVSMIVTAANKKNRDDIKSTEHSIRNIYLYTILIIALIAIVSCSIGALRIGLDIVLPEESTGSYHNSEIIARNDNIISFFTSISVVIVAIPLFLKHNKLANSLKSK